MYRILLRQLQALPAETPFLLQPALNPRDYGRAKLVNSLSLEEDDDILRLFSRWLTTIPAPNVSDDDNEDEVEVFQELAGKNAIVINDNDNNNSSKNKLWSLVDGGATDDVCAWTTREVIHRAVRTAFTSDIGRINVKQRHKYGFAASRFLQDLELMLERSSVSTQNGLRVVATSSCIGTTATGNVLAMDRKHRFAYRIRVENLPENDKTVQLLGRTWKIEDDSSGLDDPAKPIVVKAPTTGAVGHLPVLHPGEVFEYMSGCELATKSGTMSGMFHMATVPPKTRYAMVGDPVDAFQSDQKFELAVQLFPLIADDTDNDRGPQKA